MLAICQRGAIRSHLAALFGRTFVTLLAVAVLTGLLTSAANKTAFSRAAHLAG
jgi:hypothetical protein